VTSIAPLTDLNEAIRLDPGYALAYFSRGELYKSNGDVTHAMSDMNDTLRLDPNYAVAYFIRGQISYLLGNAPAALEDFTKAIKLDANEATTYFKPGRRLLCHRRPQPGCDRRFQEGY